MNNQCFKLSLYDDKVYIGDEVEDNPCTVWKISKNEKD